MLVFTNAFHFLFRLALPLSPTDALGIDLGNALNMLIVRGIRLLPKQEFLKSTLIALPGEIFDRLVLGNWA